MALPYLEEGGVARCCGGRGLSLFGREGAWPARRAAALGLRALESGVTAAQSVAGNAV